jgi:hypothetical protein
LGVFQNFPTFGLTGQADISTNIPASPMIIVVTGGGESSEKKYYLILLPFRCCLVS